MMNLISAIFYEDQMMKIKSICFSLALIVPIATNAQNTVIIHGKVSGDTKGYNQVYCDLPGEYVDTVTIEKGEFKIELPFKGTIAPGIYAQYAISINRDYRYLPLLIDQPGAIEIEMDIEKGLRSAKITGIKTTELYYSFLIQRDAVNSQMNEVLTRMYDKTWVPANDPLATRLYASRDSLNQLLQGKLITDFVLSNKDSYAGVYVLANYGKAALNIGDLEKNLDLLSEKIKKTADAEKLAAYIRGIKTTKIGSTPKNFVLNDENGNPFSLDQYKGKYIWIDFWASWCGPCKKAFPRMREIYAEYKDRNLEIIGISTDTKKEPWLKALETIKNPWKQVWDDKNVMSEFAVTAFPTSFLIGLDGAILVKEVGFNPNEKGPIVNKLEELLGPSKINFSQPDDERKEPKTEGEIPAVKIKSDSGSKTTPK